jgi:hypothetical protein
VTDVDLAGPMMKLDRAEVHIDVLEGEVDAFLAQEPRPFDVRFEYEEAPDGSRSYLGRAVIRRAPPTSWALIAGDAIQNIRAALEYLVFQMTPTGDELPTFPICTTRKQFKSVAGSLRDLATDHRTLIKNVQPFHDEYPDQNPLAVLRDLSNRDAHRLLVTILAARDDSETRIGADNAEIDFKFLSTSPLIDQSPVMRFVARPTGDPVQMRVEPDCTLQVCLDGLVEPDVVGTLRAIHHHVRHGVIEPYFMHGYMPQP